MSDCANAGKRKAELEDDREKSHNLPTPRTSLFRPFLKRALPPPLPVRPRFDLPITAPLLYHRHCTLPAIIKSSHDDAVCQQGVKECAPHCQLSLTYITGQQEAVLGHCRSLCSLTAPTTVAEGQYSRYVEARAEHSYCFFTV